MENEDDWLKEIPDKDATVTGGHPLRWQKKFSYPEKLKG